MKLSRYFNKIEDILVPNKALIIYDQAGKTTLLVDFLQTTKLRYKLDSGDNITIQHLLAEADFATFRG